MTNPSVLLLTPTLQTIGGVETYYRALDLERYDERLRYFFVTSERKGSFLLRAYRIVANYLRFWRITGRPGCRLVILNPSLNTNSFYRDAVFCRLALLRGKRILVFFRGWSEDMEARIRTTRLARAVFRASFAHVADFVVLADTFRERLLALGCRDDSRFWIETTVADESLAADFAIESRLRESGPLRALYLSRLVASKAPHLALEAFALAQRSHPGLEIELTIAGDGPETSTLAALIKQRRIPNVSLVGPVTGQSKAELLRRSDVLLFPTCHGEGLPNVILEAMLFGMPVITRDVGGIRTVVDHGINGFLTASTDPESFARWLVQLATDHAMRNRISRANYEKARAHYTSSAVRARFLRIVDSVLDHSPAIADGATR